MGKIGYFINTNNYVPCDHCREGYDKITMLCNTPYHHHIRRIFVDKPKNLIKLTGITTP